MKKFIAIFALVGALTSFSNQTNAQQKLAYVNSEELISLMPEYTVAVKAIEVYRKDFVDQLEKMKKEGQTKYEEYLKGEKTMSESMREIKKTELEGISERLQKFEQNAQEKVQAKQAELLKPITLKAEEAIREVAKANGITYVFDMVSTGIIVAPPGDDILPLLKTKLNLKMPTAPVTAPVAPKKTK
jgi:outer membrane protein